MLLTFFLFWDTDADDDDDANDDDDADGDDDGGVDDDNKFHGIAAAFCSLFFASVDEHGRKFLGLFGSCCFCFLRIRTIVHVDDADDDDDNTFLVLPIVTVLVFWEVAKDDGDRFLGCVVSVVAVAVVSVVAVVFSCC